MEFQVQSKILMLLKIYFSKKFLLDLINNSKGIVKFEFVVDLKFYEFDLFMKFN